MTMENLILEDRYRLDQEIGRGGMGSVYKAFDTLLERQVAVKLVSAEWLGTEGRARLLTEARAIAKLNHPNIVSVFDAGEFDGSPFIVMEYVDGANLHDHPPADLESIVSVAKQLCDALEHAHAQGVIHRDLKPENVMVGDNGTARLMDFGIARSVASRLTREGQIIGTVFYLAPELALGQEFDGRADLYALGIMLYEWVTGELPYRHGDPVAVISQHLHAPPVPPRAKVPGLPPAFDQLILQLMSKKPEDRPERAAELRKALDRPDLLDAESAGPGSLTTLGRIVRGRLVGRDKEFAHARELWSKAVDGQAQMLLISGEPGVGKTRLLREIVTQVELTGGRVLGSTSYAEGGPPYSAFRQILREVFHEASKNGFSLPQVVLADLIALAPELQKRYPDIPPNPQADPQTERHRLFESFLIFFTELIDQAPLLIYLDDAHWADSGSLDLLRHLARHASGQRLMMLATYREVELDEARPLHEVILDLSRQPLTSRIKLNRLTREQTRNLLAAIFDDEITPEFLEGIYRETEGNPFFIEEVCKTLVESGKLYFEDGCWHRPSMDELGIPQSLRVAIQSRVAKLPPETQQVLSQAAVLGREFDFETLALAAEPDEEALIDALEQAQIAQLIDERSEDGRIVFAFAHALIPATLVEGLRILQRRRMHRRAAAAIEERDPENYSALGMHLLQAGDSESGVDYLLLAGDQARLLYAHQEAIESYLQALDYSKETEDYPRAARTLMKLGLTYHNAFQFAQSRQAYEQGFIYLQRSKEIRAETAAPHPLRLSMYPPPTLDPGYAIDATSHAFINQLFSGLVELATDLSVIPDVARTWEVLEGGRKYRFHLRSDVTWSDGKPVTAADFEYAWKRILDPRQESPAGDYLLDIRGAVDCLDGTGSLDDVGVHAEDDHTLIVELERPTGYFLQSLTAAPFYPVPKHVAEANGESWSQPDAIVTNGPFGVASSSEEEHLHFARNPMYHGPSQGNVSLVEVSLYPEGGGDPIAWYEEDRLDQLPLTDLDPGDTDKARHAHADEYLTAPGLGTVYVGFNTSKPPFDDPRVRRAFCLAIDREALAGITFRGYYFPATGGFILPGLPGHSPEIAPEHDPQLARELLRQAGYAGGSNLPEIECMAATARFSSPIQEHLRAEWKEDLGIEIRWETIEWASYLERLRKEIPHIRLMGWGADYADPDDFLRLALLQAIELWGHEEYIRLIEQARHSLDQEQRLEMYRKADRILMEEVPVFPLMYGRGHMLLKPWVKQYPFSPMRWNYWKDVIIEPHD
jgi:ABC-type oligopeptide transport system substrate-binding subunit/predicted Ser/Thr protein kinase